MIAVQSSGISAAALENIGKIAPMIQPLVVGERGCAGLVAFAESATVLQDCTKDQDALGRAFRALRPAGHAEACMLDAVSIAVERLRLHANARRVLLLISESRDRSSENSLEAAVVAAQSAGVTVYAATYSVFKTALISKVQISQPRRPDRPAKLNANIGTRNGMPAGRLNPRTPDPEDGVDLLAGITELARLDKANTTQVLTAATGGTTFRFTGRKALEEAISGLGAELHSQYLLSFVPESAATGYHRLEVRVSRPAEYRIRARLGYWLSEPSH
jgi:VWFA-related protein